MDTIPGEKTGDNKVMQSTISRFACRILADRNNPKIARIYAAGFDTSRNIFLGVSARFIISGFGVVLRFPLCFVAEGLKLEARILELEFDCVKRISLIILPCELLLCLQV